MHHFHFSISPVQSFITQSRRTRDLWAGSFLLSWLAGVAMAAVRLQDQTAAICFPQPIDGVMRRLTPDWPDGSPPPLPDDDPLLRQGSIPNRFMAQVAPGFDGAAVAEAVRQAFRKLADAIWEQDFGGKAGNGRGMDRTRAIWERQVGQFWDISWVIDTTPERGLPLLDARKNWRSHFPSTEPGVKCAAMDGWQELSGAGGPGDPVLRTFWAGVHARISGSHANDLQEGEQLCAIAWIKRRFVRVFGRDFRTTISLGAAPALRLTGWPLSANVPSVLHVAAAPWLAQTIGKLTDEPVTDAATGFIKAITAYEAKTFPDSQRKPLTLGESHTHIRCVDTAISALAEPAMRVAEQLRKLDANLFFKEALANRRLFPQAPASPDDIARNLAKLCNAADASPSAFYAVLRMDGDRIGARMGDETWRPVIASALNDFTQCAVGLTDAHNGFLIYAGGDDVLAFLPVDDAMPAAKALAEAFASAFDAARAKARLKTEEPGPTLSGAIVYAQTGVPLASVVLASEQLLNNVAKTRAGRNALAVRVVKPGGPVCEWACKWPAKDSCEPGPLALQELALPGSAVFSSGFLNRLRELHNQWWPKPESAAPSFDQSTTELLLLSELMGTRQADGREWPRGAAREQLHRLLPLLVPPWNKETGRWQPDGAVLLRFLSQKGNL